MRHSTTRRRAPLALTATLLTAVALTATGCGGGGQSVSTEEPEKQTRFEKRADQVAEVWPDAKPVEGRHDSMLPAESARPGETAKGGKASRTVSVTVGHSACDKDYGAHVQETGKLVIVAGWAKKKKDSGVCTGQLITDKVKVKLDGELGDRPVVDAATGKELKG